MPERSVLIEKFTGHKCSNCPEATRKLKELKEFYGEQLIPITIHPGNLIEFTSIDDNYPYDFTTNSSDTIAEDMGANFLPLGSINRINGGISDRCFTKEEWSTEINKLLYDSDGNPLPRNINFEVQSTFNEKNRELTIQTNFNFSNILDENYNLCILIAEDSIIAPQIDGIEYITNYKHSHIYRCAVNGTYGQDISQFKYIGVNDKFGYQATHTLILDEDSNINWTIDWDNINNCYIVAYVYNTANLVIEHSTKKYIMK